MRSVEKDSVRKFVLDPFEPAYLPLLRSGELAARSEAALHALERCRSCPRECGVNRLEDHTCVCHTGRHARVSSAFPHLGEEDCLRGDRGSGTIFFAHCNLHCVFCQNWDISQRGKGEEADAERIAELMLRLQELGCHNINFVTPEHVAPQVIEALVVAIHEGLRIPVVYNTSAYDSVETLRLLDGLVDIFMPDFKYWRRDTARRLSGAEDYPDRAQETVLEMHRQTGPLKFGPGGIARRGVLVRHLVMPGQVDESREIFRFLADEVSTDTYVNIMAQYHPEHQVGRGGRGAANRFDDIDRRPEPDEIEEAYAAAREAGLWRFDKAWV